MQKINIQFRPESYSFLLACIFLSYNNLPFKIFTLTLLWSSMTAVTGQLGDCLFPAHWEKIQLAA